MIPLKDDNPRSTFPVLTVALIVINVIVFYFEFQLGYVPVIERFGAVPMVILEGQRLETLFTSMFLHGGFMHLAGNMLYLWIFGDNIEHYLGRGRFIVFYFLCGLLAVWTHILLGGISNVPMVGASGAISGILGAYLIKYPKARVLVLFPIFGFLTMRPVPALVVLGLWFVMQLFSGIGSIGVQGGGVAFWAHVGGFVAGVVLILIFPAKRRQSTVVFR
ncbi:MAG: rhomboid family intramembrane serine protease [bacterium]